MSQPASVVRLVVAEVVLSLLGVVTVVLTAVLRDDLVRSWAEGRSPSVRETLRVGGVEALEKSGANPPAFVLPAIVLFVVLVSLLWVLTAFVTLGFGWARLVLTGVTVFMVVATIAGLRTGPPSIFAVVAALSFVVELVSLVFLWHPDTTRHLRSARGSIQAPDPVVPA